MANLIFQVIAGMLGIFLADRYVSGVVLEIIPGESIFFGIELTEYWQLLAAVGIVFGLINFFIMPLLRAITLPLRLLTFGLFGLVLNMAVLFALDVLFRELTITGLFPLFWTTLIVWGVSFFLGLNGSRINRIINGTK